MLFRSQFDLVHGLEEKLEHRPSMGDRGDVIGFYAVAKLVGGGHAFEFMSDAEVRLIMVNTQSKGKYGPWKDHYTEMGRKTVIRRLAKFLPLSVEFQTAVALDELATAGQDQHIESIDGDFSIVPEYEEEQAETVDTSTGEITAPSEPQQDEVPF